MRNARRVNLQLPQPATLRGMQNVFMHGPMTPPGQPPHQPTQVMLPSHWTTRSSGRRMSQNTDQFPCWLIILTILGLLAGKSPPLSPL